MSSDDSYLSSSSHRESLETLLRSTLPMDEVVYAFGYGSGVFSQNIIGHEQVKDVIEEETKVIDMIVVVRDAMAFHRANVSLNPSHYYHNSSHVPGIRLSEDGTASWCTWWQRHAPPHWLGRNPGLYFFLTDTVKYGIVQVDDLRDDLGQWKYLYLAGRMQKPVLTLIDDNNNNRKDVYASTVVKNHKDSSIHHLQHSVNLPAALASSLLLLSNNNHNNNTTQPQHGQTTTTTTTMANEVYQQIARLSYLGDFRVSYGAEDPQKIQRLVEGPGQMKRFESLYSHAATALQQQGILSITQEDTTGTTTLDSASATSTTTTSSTTDTMVRPVQTTTWSWDTSPEARKHLWDQLPFVKQSSVPENYQHHLRTQLTSIVAPSARYQSFKGIVTAGPRKAWNYAARKLAKGLLRR